LASLLSAESSITTGDSPSNKTQDESRSRPGERVRIAIVEDERLVAENLKETLEEKDFEVVAMAATGADAIQKITSTDPDLILMDIRLKGEMDGIDAAIVLQNTWKRNLRIVFLTAHSQKQFPHLSALDLTFVYLTKPFSQEQLFSAIRRVL
jgi:CheY-like chemotaxis protein